jgi:4-hydroxy-2-oxoheptanedioate aldolase
MKTYLYTSLLVLLLLVKAGPAQATDTLSQPKRINKCIELLEQGQPIYYIDGYGGYEEGKKLAKTWADLIMYNTEHRPLDFTQLNEFMRGLVDGGPTPSGHRTPTVVVVLPLLGLDAQTVKSNGWMVEQALAQGVHGVHLNRARSPEAVQQFIQSARYPIHKQGFSKIGEGLRGWGSQKFAAWVWGISEKEYLLRADVWKLNPQGELFFGVKIEDRVALANAARTLTMPGIAFAEHGPRDMGLSYGYLEGRADPPVPAEVDAAGRKVLDLCNKNGLYFLDNVLPDNVEGKIKWGVRIGAGSNQQAAEVGRKYTGRKMPWKENQPL